MKISAVEIHFIRVPCSIGAAPTAFIGVGWASMDTLLLRVVTDQGIEGWGEAFGHAACPATRTAMETQVGPAFLAQDARDVRGLARRMAQRFHLFGRNGPLTYALSAFDIALWDIAGKEAGQPLWRLLGGTPRRDLAAYASLLRYGEPGAVAKAARRATAEGFHYVKLHEIDPRVVHAAREAAAGALLMVDANCAWAVEEAAAMAAKMRPDDLYWLEEPVWPPENHAGLAEVRQRGGIAIAAGENAAGLYDFRHLFEAHALDIAQPSVAKVGGITEMLDVVALAKACSVRLVPHCAYFGPGYLASLHVAAALAPEAPFEHLFVDLEASLYHELVLATGGRVPVPDGPGLGRDPDADVLRRYSVGDPIVLRA